MYTREDYLNQKCSHREYYAQFVTPRVKNIVVGRIGKTALVESGDISFNDIALCKWDALSDSIRGAMNVSLFKQLSCPMCLKTPGRIHWSLSDSICIAKEAARQVVEQINKEV